MTDHITAALRGEFAKRAAKGLLGALPSGVPLALSREPDNPYDPNAVLVVLQPDEIDLEATEGLQESLTFALAGYGIEWEEFLAAEWPLGYVGKEWASELAPRMDRGEATSATLGFNGQGKPTVEIEVGEAERHGE